MNAEGKLPFTDAGRRMAKAAASPKADGLNVPEQHKPVYECARHEGDHALRNLLSGARERERRQASSPASTPSADLAK